MKHFFSLLLIFISIGLRSQSLDLFGIYQVDWGDSPSYRCLILSCDSTYRFITHWDLGGREDIEPATSEIRKWRLTNNNKITLKTPTWDYKSFDILSNGNLVHQKKRQKETLIKIGGINQDCSVSYFIADFRPERYTVTRLLPELKMKSAEVYANGKLVMRTNYYDLTEQEYDDLFRKQKMLNRSFTSLLSELKFKIAWFETFWLAEKIESWNNDQMTVKYLDKSGQEIKKE